MKIQNQLRWGGLWIILASVMMNGMNILVSLNVHNVLIQAIYGIGFTGLALAATCIHIVHARRAGSLGLVAYLLSVLSVVYSNVVTFLSLAELTGIQGIHETLLGVWEPVMRIAIYGVFVGWTLLGLSVARAGVFPKWAGILVALGVAIQFQAQYAAEMIGPWFFVFTVSGSLIFGIGLISIGWALCSGTGWLNEESGLSDLDRTWGGPLIILTSLLLAADAYINTFGVLTIRAGVIHLLSHTALMLSMVILYTGQARRAGGVGWVGFVFIHLGSTLFLIPTYLILAQLTGQIDSNQALMASWVDIPVGRIGLYLIFAGSLLFGISVVRAEVYPRWSGWLLLIGLALLLPSQFQSEEYLFSIFWVIGATFQGVGLGWMGWTLLNKQKTEHRVQLRELTR